MERMQSTKLKNHTLTQLLAVGSLAIGSIATISAAPAGAVTFNTGRLDFGIFNSDFASNVTGVAGNTFNVTFNPSSPATVFSAQESFSPTFVPGVTVGNTSPTASLLFDSGSTSNFNYRLTNDLVFGFNNSTSLTVLTGALFEGSRTSVNSIQFQIAPGSSPVSFFTSGTDISTNNTLAISFNDTGAGTGGVYTASASPVPEPFTIIGTIVGGTAAFRMRKKMTANKK